MIPSNQKFLQLTIPPEEHVSLISQGTYENDEYWEKLPTYLIARCPLCGAEYTDKIDPHSLADGLPTHDSSPDYYFNTVEYQRVGCNHRLAVQGFVNLERQIPSELNSYRADRHVPFVMPFLVPDDIKSAAVIHSFAICRLEDKQGRIYNYKAHLFEEQKTREEMRDVDKHRWRKRPITDRSKEDTGILKSEAIFVPRYTAYAVTYYAETPEVIVDRRMKPQLKYVEEMDREFEPVFMASMPEMAVNEPHAYDLRYWVKQGKLNWLDLESPDLPLKNGPAEDFPYVNIHDVSGQLRRFSI